MGILPCVIVGGKSVNEARLIFRIFCFRCCTNRWFKVVEFIVRPYGGLKRSEDVDFNGGNYALSKKEKR